MARLKTSPAAATPTPERVRTSSRWATGRPKKAAPELRRHHVRFRVDDADLSALRARAKLAGRSLSDFVRAAVLSSGVAVLPRPGSPKAESPELFALRRAVDAAGVNLNQIARRLNTSGEHVPQEVREAAAALDAVLRQILAGDVFD